MALKKRWVLLILVMLLLGTPLALAAGDTAVSTHTPSLAQTAVRAVLPYLAGSDCDLPTEAAQPAKFDLAQPMPTCWLVPDQSAAHD